MSESSQYTDIVLINALGLSANIGSDCWHKSRPQPLNVSIYLHLQPSYLTAAGHSDSVLDSIHYGHLSKAISTLVSSKDSFTGIDALIDAINQEAFALAGDAAVEVRVVVELPKLILLAGGFEVDVTTPRSSPRQSRKVSITDLTLPVIIGVTPPERKAKQRVITNIVFYERRANTSSSPSAPVDYPEIIDKISKDIEVSSHLTLEKFVLEIVRTACLSSDNIEAVTVRSQKPSAISFAHSSGVEITRNRVDLLARYQ